MFGYNNVIIVVGISLTREIMAAPFGQNTVLFLAVCGAALQFDLCMPMSSADISDKVKI